MSYVTQVLQPGETLRFRTNIHWFVYLKALVALIVGLALLGWYYAEGQSVFILLFGGVVFTLTALVLAIPAWLRRFGTEVAVTDRRVIYKTGLIQRHTIEINIDRSRAPTWTNPFSAACSALAQSRSGGPARVWSPCGTSLSLSSYETPCWSGEQVGRPTFDRTRDVECEKPGMLCIAS
jgi:hypothetical protein